MLLSSDWRVAPCDRHLLYFFTSLKSVLASSAEVSAHSLLSLEDVSSQLWESFPGTFGC